MRVETDGQFSLQADTNAITLSVMVSLMWQNMVKFV